MDRKVSDCVLDSLLEPEDILLTDRRPQLTEGVELHAGCHGERLLLLMMV
jgi:hypothetical protein